MEMVQSVMTARLAKDLKLDDEQTVVLFRRFCEVRDQSIALRKERQEIIKSLKGAINTNAGDEAIEAKLKELVAHDAKMVEVKEKAYEEAAKGLAVAQRARLYVFMNDFENDMRRLIQKTRESLGKPGPGGPGGRPGAPVPPPAAPPAGGGGPAAPVTGDAPPPPPPAPEGARPKMKIRPETRVESRPANTEPKKGE